MSNDLTKKFRLPTDQEMKDFRQRNDAKQAADDELTALAAKGAGIKLVKVRDMTGWMLESAMPYNIAWTPLTDDADAFRLAVKCHLHMVPLSFLGPGGGTVKVGVADWDGVEERLQDDPYAATRRAIVRAAASLGERA